MTPVSLHFQGFRSFENPTSVDFSTLQGLIYLTGRNELEPELGANGAGKSSVFEALYWCLYGKTSRNLRAGEVKTWYGENPCKAEFKFNAQQHTYKVFRSWKPNQLKITTDDAPLQDVEQEAVDTIVGMGEELFSLCRYFSQFGSSFLDLNPGKQLELYSKALDLSPWEQSSEKAAEEAVLFEETGAALQQALERATGQKQELAQQLQQMLTAQEQWQVQHTNKSRELMQKVAAGQKNLPVAPKAPEKQKEAETELSQALKLMSLTQSRVEDAETELHKVQHWGTGLDSVCPTCGSAVSKKNITRSRQEKEDVVRQKTQTLEKLLKQQTQQKDTISAKVTEFRGRYDKIFQAWQQAHTRLQIAQSELKSVLAETSPYTKQIETLQQRQKRLLKQSRGAQHQLQKIQQRAEQSRYWIKGFRELRLWLIDQSLRQLDLEANRALQQLGLPEWHLKFDVERETKQGGIKKGFSVTVESPYNDRPVPLEAWSGGESQRLRLACSMGIADLFCSALGVESGIEFWDEPSTWINKEGVPALLEALELRAVQKPIWIADHRILDFPRFSATILAIKDDAGSRLEIQ